MTVQQILDWVDRYYPNLETVANKIIDLNQVYIRVFMELIRDKNIIESFTDYTISDQYTYTLPSDCKPENVVKISISSDVTGSISDTTTWQEYEYADLNTDVEDGYYWTKLTNTTYILTKDGIAIDTSNYEIHINYYQTPASLTDVSDVIASDDEYGDALKYGLIRMIASKGQNPDTEMANYYQALYDETMKALMSSMNEKSTVTPIVEEILESRW